MAAQAGVRYSISNPHSYFTSNLLGFGNILECCRHHSIQHLVYASSSSVYGANSLQPFSTAHPVNHPVSLYAATKKSNELMAHSYSYLYNMPTIGLRFFTVYGPWGRPDMAPMFFADKIAKGEAIDVYNFGKHRRDFTYIDDIVEGVVRTLDTTASANSHWNSDKPDPASPASPYRVYNIGCNKPAELMHFIELMKQAMGRQVEKKPVTYATR